MQEKKLINYAPYAPVTLTAEGEKIAKNILKKHENLTEFFTEVLGASKAEALDVACKMEHIVSEKLFENMMKLTQYAKTQKDFKKIF